MAFFAINVATVQNANAQDNKSAKSALQKADTEKQAPTIEKQAITTDKQVKKDCCEAEKQVKKECCNAEKKACQTEKKACQAEKKTLSAESQKGGTNAGAEKENKEMKAKKVKDAPGSNNKEFPKKEKDQK